MDRYHAYLVYKLPIRKGEKKKKINANVTIKF